MKNIVLILLSLFVLCSFTDKKAKKEAGQKSAERTNVVLDLFGHIENAGFDFKNARYRLYRDNMFVAGGNTDRFGSIELHLMRNSHYLLELSTPEFVTKKIYIDTYVPENYSTVGSFDFDVTLIPAEIASEEDICLLDVPYAIIFFNGESMEFDHDKEYTERMEETEKEIISNSDFSLN